MQRLPSFMGPAKKHFPYIIVKTFRAGRVETEKPFQDLLFVGNAGLPDLTAWVKLGKRSGNLQLPSK